MSQICKVINTETQEGPQNVASLKKFDMEIARCWECSQVLAL